MLSQRKGLAGAAEPAGPNSKGLVRRRTKTKKPAGASAQGDNSSPQKVSASKNGRKNLSSYWLMTSEPESQLDKGVEVKFSPGDRKAQPKQTACWDGLHNSQPQNFPGALKREKEAFYQSNCEEPGIAGLVKLVR